MYVGFRAGFRNYSRDVKGVSFKGRLPVPKLFCECEGLW